MAKGLLCILRSEAGDLGSCVGQQGEGIVAPARFPSGVISQRPGWDADPSPLLFPLQLLVREAQGHFPGPSAAAWPWAARPRDADSAAPRE